MSPVWELADVTNQVVCACTRLVSACFGLPQLFCSAFDCLCIVLSVYGSLSLMPSSFNTDLFTLAVLRPMGLFVCLAVLRCSPSGSLFCLLSGPNPSKQTSPALLLGAYRFQSSKVDLSSSSAFGLLASVSICLPHKTIAERPKVVRTRGVFNM